MRCEWYPEQISPVDPMEIDDLAAEAAAEIAAEMAIEYALENNPQYADECQREEEMSW